MLHKAYVYSADGTKVKKTAGSKVVDYLTGFQYENSTLQFFPTSEGYFDLVKNKYIYNYTDHLGNVRLSYMKSGSGLEIIEESNYYPFGLKHEGYNTSVGNAAYQYKYNGKELQETGMYDYGARFYMPDLGRWGVVDPLAEKMTRYSPYNYAFNNPLRFIDPDGRQATDIFKWGNDGKLTKVADSNTDVIYAENQFKKDGKTLKADAKGVEIGDKGIIDANKEEIRLESILKDSKGGKSDLMTTLKLNDSNKAAELAEYLYNNAKSEFTNGTYTSKEGNLTKSVISTFGLIAKSPVDPRALGMTNFSYFEGVFTLTKQDHNHPGNSLPSGYFPWGNVGKSRDSYEGSYDYDNTLTQYIKILFLEFIEMALTQHTIKMEHMKNKLLLVLTFIFQLGWSQIPCISKNYKINNFIDAFIYTNNDENFIPTLSSIYVSSLYYENQGYMITITRENNSDININPKAKNLNFFKYKKFNLLLKGNTAKDLGFLNKIIMDKSISNNSALKFTTPNSNISNDPYQWFLLFDREMNLINYSLPEQENKIKEIFEKFGIPTSKIGKKDCK